MRKLGILFVVFLFLGCSSKKEDSSVITVWHWMTDRHASFEKLAAQYEQIAGVKVKFELYAPANEYSRKVVAAAQAKVLPDIYGILDKKKIFASFIESGHVADLTADFQNEDAAWEKSIFAKALAVNKFEPGNIYNIKPGIYGVPIDVTNIQVLYNKNLLKKAGFLKPPSNFEEFLKVTEALNEMGVAGLVSGWGEVWMIDCFASNYAFNIMGEEKVLATFRGEVPYTDPDWIKVLTIFKKLADHKALIEGIVTKGNKFAEQDFALERAAFAFNGSWCVNVYHEMNPKLDYGVMLPPEVNSDRPMMIWGGAGTSLVVNGRSTLKDQAIAFLKWLTQEPQQALLAAETKNLPANRKAMEDIPQILSDFVNATDYTTHPTIWPYNEDPLVSEAFAKGIQSIIVAEKTPVQVAKEVQTIKEKQMHKAIQAAK